jgi:hypothetical protein
MLPVSNDTLLRVAANEVTPKCSRRFSIEREDNIEPVVGCQGD